MKTAILYASSRWQKTKKLVKNIVENVSDVTLIDVTKSTDSDLSNFDIIGMASGFYNGKFTKSIIDFIQNNLPEQKNFFFMYTCGSEAPKNLQDITESVLDKNPNIIGAYDCINSRNPFGLPNKKEISRAVQFVGALA